jgi:hypothetical protein
MQRCSESVGALAAALAKAQAEIANPEKNPNRNHRLALPALRQPDVSLCALVLTV